MATINQEGATERIRAMDGKHPTPIVRDAQALLLRGIDALERNHFDQAVGLLRQSVQLDAQSFYGYLALGIALTKALEIPAAQEALEMAISLEPKNFYAHFRMAELFQRVGVPTLATAEFELSLDLAQTDEERKMARDTLAVEQKRRSSRAWRPNFSKLVGKSGRKR